MLHVQMSSKNSDSVCINCNNGKWASTGDAGTFYGPSIDKLGKKIVVLICVLW